MNVRNKYKSTARRQDPSALAAVTIWGVTDGGNTLCVLFQSDRGYRVERKSSITRQNRPEIRIRITSIRRHGQQQRHHDEKRVLRLNGSINVCFPPHAETASCRRTEDPPVMTLGQTVEHCVETITPQGKLGRDS